jgi:predicted O-methyltransferase YrrM
MQSRRRNRSRWAHCNTPEAKRRRRAAADARREALAATLPPVPTGPEPLTLWQTITVQSEAARLGVLNKPLRIVELGSWVGHSALKMAEACEGLVDYEIHCVDHWNGGNAIQRKAADEHDAYREFCRNVGDRLGKTIIPHRTSTTEGAADWGSRVPEQQPIDILFIDAGHEYDEVLSDIQRWQPYVRPGGLILGHDYSYLFPGVKRAVHETYGYAVANLGTVWAVRLDYRGEAQLPTDKAA